MHCNTTSFIVSVTALLLATLVAGTTTTARAAAPDSPARFEAQLGLYEEALTRFEAADYGTAAIHLKNLLVEQPSFLPARVLLGRTYLRAGRPAEAAKELMDARTRGADERLIQLPLARALLLAGRYEDALAQAARNGADDGETASLLVIAGDARLNLGQTAEAEAAFSRAETLAPADPAPKLGRARLLIAQGRHIAAAIAAERAVKLAPRDAQAWFTVAEIWRLDRNRARALEAYERVLAIDPNHMQARLGRAALRFHDGDDEAALADVRHVYASVVNQPQAMYIEAMILARSEDREQARARLEQVTRALANVASAPAKQRVEAQLLLGATQFALGNFQQARESLDEFSRHQPAHVGALKLLGALALQQDDPRHALDILERASKLAPSDVQLRVLLAKALTSSGNLARAEQVLIEARGTDPDNAEVRMALARTRIEMGKESTAVRDLEASVELESGTAAEVFLLGLQYLRTGKLEAARRAGETLVRREPANPTSYNFAGLAALASGDTADARTHFERALELDPTFLPATNNLALIDIRAGRPDAARTRFEALLTHSPHAAHAMREIGRIAAGQGDFAEASRWLKKAGSADPNDIQTQLLSIEVARRQGDLQGARNLARALESQHPENVAAKLALARTHLALEATGDAVSVLQGAAHLVRGSGPESLAVARLQHEAGDLAGARQSLLDAVSSAPGLLAAHVRLVALDVEEERFDAALEHARNARRANPNEAIAVILEGDALSHLARFDEALAAYRAAQTAEMTSELLLRIFNARSRVGEAAAASKALEDWAASHPDDLLVRRALATHYMNMKQTTLAIEHHERLLADQPDDPLVMNNLAWLYYLAGDARALEHAEAAYRLAPKQAGVLDTIGWILVEQGQPKRGVLYLRDAQSRSSKDPLIRYHLAVGLERLGRTDEARRELEGLLVPGVAFDGAAEARALLARLSRR